MRVLGDLNGPEGNALNNPPGTGTTEKNGNVNAHGRHFGDLIGEQRLEPARHSNSPARLFARHTNEGLWFLLMVVILAMLGAGAYSYLRLRNNHVTLSQVPGLLRSIPILGWTDGCNGGQASGIVGQLERFNGSLVPTRSKD